MVGNILKFRWLPKSNVGERLFTFDGKKVYNLFKDYPYSLSDEEITLFNRANPFWANYFADRRIINDYQRQENS